MPIDPRDMRKTEAEHVPTLCQKCTSGRQARIDWPEAGWVCWRCYDELKPQSPLEAELERRIDATPWQRGEDEPRSKYRARMLAEWRGMGGIRRMPT